MITCAVILAVSVVTTAAVDLGPALKARAEQAASDYMGRPMHIGRLSVRLWLGRFVLEDIVIDGLTPESRPFLTARRLTVSMPWRTLFDRRIVFDAIEMTDWRMYAERLSDGSHSFPRFTRDTPRGESDWTTTLQYVHAYRGEFTYEDHGTPWTVVTRNLDVTVGRPTAEYRGQASFSNGTVIFQDYEPFRVDMTSSFVIDGGLVRFSRLDLDSEGARTELVGSVDIGGWPDMSYELRSTLDFPTQKAIWFARDDFTVSGTGEFVGTFRMFREQMPDGRRRIGRELKGAFSSVEAGVNAYRFGDLRGSLVWVPERFEVNDATATVYGGTARFDYRMASLGQPDRRGVATFDASYANVDLAAFTNFLELPGIRLAGRASGVNVLQWPLGRSGEVRGRGDIRAEPPTSSPMMTRQMPVVSLEAELRAAAGPFSNHTPRQPVPIRGALAYAYDPAGIEIGPSQVATPSTYVEFEGSTAWGDRSRIPFHVTSADWQESDRLLAGILTALGTPTNAIPIGGYGTFDGVMLGNFRRPRIEGTFTGERLRAFDVVWGSLMGKAVIENRYADVTEVVVGANDSVMYIDGRFSLGYPRRDGGDEIDARINVIRRPVADLRHAFGLDEYDVDGVFSGEFRVFGAYRRPFGFGQMAIVDGVAYRETFDTAAAAVRLEGSGVRLDSIAMTKGGGRATGAAYIDFTKGTYSFNLDGRRIPVESLALAASRTTPLFTGSLDFTAGGNGAFAEPRYDVRLTISDLFVGDEGIGQVVSELNLNDRLLAVKVEAASPRLAVSGAGRIMLTPELDADVSFSVADTSLDPYVRVFNPGLSPFTTAVASGNVRVVGHLANIDELLVDVSVDRFDLGLFDYQLRNARPITMALDRHILRVGDFQLVGEETQLDISGVVDLHDETVAVRANGDAGLGILQGLVSDVRSSGRASLEATFEGPMRDPLVTGTMRVDDGRIRHFDLPHALENISGPVRFDSRSIRLDEVTAQLGQGPVRFGGRIDIERYQPTGFDVTMTGQDMRLRFPAGMRSLVDADLRLQGAVEAPALTGTVFVRSAVYTRNFDASGALFDLPGDGAIAHAGGALAPDQLLSYDVQITAPSTLEVRNAATRVVANAELLLQGTYSRPLLFGRAEIVRGEFTFEARRYQITRGSIDFNDPTRIRPFFDVETETLVRVPGQTYRITASAAGTMDRLTPTFNADPPLPEVEVLGLLLSDVAPGQDVEFRQFSTDVTPQQQLLRERATRALTGVVTSEIGRVVEQTFGVDTFQLTPSLVDPNAQSSRLDPAARLTIGKRLSDRIYLTYSRSLSSSTRDQIILLEYDQTDRFSWILSRNEDRTYALDVRVRRSF